MPVKKICPNCDEAIEYLEASQQIEGTLGLPEQDNEPLFPITQWKPPEEQCEEVVYTCPMCKVEIEEQTLKEWGVR